MSLVRSLPVALALVLFVGGGGGASANRSKRKALPAKKLLDKASGPLALTIESVDLTSGRVEVSVSGINRSPAARLFTFHDDKDRHFIALDARCEGAGKVVRCSLDYPRPYAGSNVLGMTAFLHGREVPAPPEQVAAKWEEARARMAAGANAPAAASDGGRGAAKPSLDGGVRSKPPAPPPTAAPQRPSSVDDDR